MTARLSYGVLGEVRQLLVCADRLEVLGPPEARADWPPRPPLSRACTRG